MTDELAGKPKYLSDTLRNEQSVSDLDSTFGVSVSEEVVTANKAKGMQHAGWVKTLTYVDQHGNTRNKSETLIAAGSMVSDASDDSTVADLVITFSTQAANTTVAANVDDAIFTVVATVNGVAPLTYQWQWVDSAHAGEPTPTWNNVSMGTGATSATYNAGTFGEGDSGALFRCVVSTVGGVTATSAVATLTVTA